MYRFLCQCKFSFLLAEYPGVRLLNHMINICLWETVFAVCILISTWYCQYVLLSHSNKWEVVSHYVWIHISLNEMFMDILCVYFPSIYPFGEVFIQTLCSFLIGVVIFLLLNFWEFSLYFGYKTFIGYMICKIFPLICFFISLRMSFKEQKCLILIKSNFSMFILGVLFWCCI